MGYIDEIETLGACRSALNWLRTEAHPTIADAWSVCPRGDWMLWLAGRCAGPVGDLRRVPLTTAAADCAEMTLVHVPTNARWPRLAVEVVRAWARGEATVEQVRAVASAAANAASWVARVAGATCATRDAARAAAWAADVAGGGGARAAARSASLAAWTASNAAALSAARGASNATWADVEVQDTTLRMSLAQCADIVRKHYPVPPVLSPS